MPLRPPPSAQEFAELTLPTPRWLIDKLLPGAGWTLLVAKAKTGKSLLAMQVVTALELGVPAVGQAVVKPIHGLYIQLDAPPSDWQEQVKRLTPPERTWDTYTLDHLPLYVLDATHVALQTQLREIIKARAYGFVVWDALEKLSKQDMNTKEGCQVVLDRMKAVHPGPNLVIHHPRKPHGDSMDSLIDAAAGHHYLTADASAIWGLTKSGSRGALRVITRASDETLELEREPNFLWRAGSPKTGSSPPQSGQEKKYGWD